MILQDYDPEWSETEPSEETVPELTEDAASHAQALPEAINASVSPGPMPTENPEISEQHRAEIAFLLQQRLQGEFQAGTPVDAGAAGHLGAYAAGFRLQNPFGQPATATRSTVNMSRTVWRQGSQVAEWCLRVPGVTAPTASQVPWRLRANLAATESLDFGLGPVVRDACVNTGNSDLQRHASPEMHATTISSCAPALRPRGQVVLPPRRRAPLADETNATPDADGLTSLPPRPPRGLPMPRATRPRAGPYDLPGPDSSREERANAASALGMSRRHYERVVLGMER